MYESDRLPESWVARINAMDEARVSPEVRSGVSILAASPRSLRRDLELGHTLGNHPAARYGCHRSLQWSSLCAAASTATKSLSCQRHGRSSCLTKMFVGHAARRWTRSFSTLPCTSLWRLTSDPRLQTSGLSPAGEMCSLGSGLFRFLSVFKWEKRKGWDILLRAYFQEFTAADDVVLIIKTQSFHSGDNFEAKVREEIQKAQELAPGEPARFKLLATDLKLRELPRLYRAADAFVLPSRGEGWGRPHVEAMAMGLPVIATNWSGSTEFLTADASLPLRIDGLEPVEDGLEGHRWAVPSEAHLRELMRWVSEHRVEAQALGEARA